MENGEKKKFFTKKRIIILSSCIAGVILIPTILFLIYVNVMLGKIHYVSKKDVKAAPNTSSVDSNALTEQMLRENSTPLAYDQDVYNVLLIGSDGRADVKGSRSDTMMLLSINKKTSKIVITSLMRDTFLPIPGYGSNRLNAAFSFGGPDLLMKTVEQNYRIKISNYIGVDFITFIKIVDKLGGVRTDVSKDEMVNLNKNITEVNRCTGKPDNDDLLAAPGTNLLLDGKQALSYARIRYVGNADFERTERQRKVLMQIYTKLKSQNALKLNDILNTLLPDVTTNISQGELFSLLLSVPTISGYTVEQDRVPIDNSFKGVVIDGMDVLSVNLDKNIAEMQSRIYDIATSSKSGKASGYTGDKFAVSSSTGSSSSASSSNISSSSKPTNSSSTNSSTQPGGNPPSSSSGSAVSSSSSKP